MKVLEILGWFLGGIAVLCGAWALIACVFALVIWLGWTLAVGPIAFSSCFGAALMLMIACRIVGLAIGKYAVR